MNSYRAIGFALWHKKKNNLENNFYRNMATYSMEINERSAHGKALIAYLEALQVNLQRLPNIRLRKSSYERSMDDIKHGRIETFASADEMCKSLGI